MHRYYSASRLKATAKVIQTITNNVQKDRNRKRPADNKYACFTYSTPVMFSRNLLDTCRNPHQDGLTRRAFHRCASGYALHPEKLKQIIKERDGHKLCIYYDSDTYKQKARDLMEEQTRAISVGPSRSKSDTDVTYEHILSCAQPRKKPKVIIDHKSEEPKEEQRKLKTFLIPKRVRMSKKTKEKENDTIEVQCVFPRQQKKKKTQRKVYRKRTTIMPVYLKKKHEHWSMREKAENDSKPKEPAIKPKYIPVPHMMKKPMNITKSQYKHQTKPTMTHKDNHSLTMNIWTYQKLKEDSLLRREKLCTHDWKVHID